MSKDIHSNDQEWKDLLEALNIKGPLAEYQILQFATRRIRALTEDRQTTTDDCTRVMHEVLPDKHAYEPIQACWTMAAEIRRLREELQRANA